MVGRTYEYEADSIDKVLVELRELSELLDVDWSTENDGAKLQSLGIPFSEVRYAY